MTKTIAIFGSARIEQQSEDAAIAYQVGKLLAQAGFHICNGGYTGTMEACSRGAREVEGQVIGVTSKVFGNRSPNCHLTENLLTENLSERICKLMEIADGYIVLDGNIGTLAELFLAWNLIFIGKRKPLIIIGQKIQKLIEILPTCSMVGEEQRTLIKCVVDSKEAVAYLKNWPFE